MQSVASKDVTRFFLLGSVALAIAGCGSSHGAPSRSEQSGASTASASSNSPFLVRADAICARTNAEIVAIPAKSASAAEVKRVVPRTISIERHGTEALEGLNPPAALEQDWQRILTYRRGLVHMLGELLSAAKRNNGASVKPLIASKKRVHTSLSQTAKANGFKDCAKVGRVG